jgi:ATP-dependent DNA helicase RecG
LNSGAFVKIGYFKTDYDLLFQDVILGSLFSQVEKTMNVLTTKYLKAYTSYESIKYQLNNLKKRENKTCWVIME